MSINIHTYIHIMLIETNLINFYISVRLLQVCYVLQAHNSACAFSCSTYFVYLYFLIDIKIPKKRNYFFYGVAYVFRNNKIMFVFQHHLWMQYFSYYLWCISHRVRLF